MTDQPAPERLLSTGDVATLAGVTRTTIRRWIDDNKIVPETYTLGGHPRFTRAEVDRALKASAR